MDYLAWDNPRILLAWSITYLEYPIQETTMLQKTDRKKKKTEATKGDNVFLVESPLHRLVIFYYSGQIF